MQHLYKALNHLFPNKQQFVDFEIRSDANGDQYIAVWHLPQPQPTDAELEAAIIAYDAAQTQQQADSATLRQQVVTLAQSAVGQPANTLTAAQVRALMALLLYKAGALDVGGTVRPLNAWIGD